MKITKSLNIIRKAVPNIEINNGIEVIAVSPIVVTIKKRHRIPC
jgi:hypothetical protein